MTTVTIVMQNAPHQENNKAWHALRFAGAALAEDLRVRVHLLDEARRRRLGYENREPIAHEVYRQRLAIAPAIRSGAETGNH